MPDNPEGKEEMAIVKTALYSGVWQQFFDLINDNVSDPGSRSVKWVFSSEPDALMSTSSAYPLIIVNPIETPNDRPLTFDIRNVSVSLDVDIFALKSEQLDTPLSDSIYDVIDDNRDTLYALGLKELDLGGSSYNTVERGGLKVHVRTISFDMTFQH